MNTLMLIGGLAGAAAAIGVVLRGLWRVNRRIVHIADLVIELSPNHGQSVKDTVVRTEEKVDTLAEQFSHHLKDHEQRRPRLFGRSLL